MLAAIGGVRDAYPMALLAVVALVLRGVRPPVSVDLLFVGLLALDAWLTALGAFDSFNHDDSIGHFVLPAAVTPVLLVALERADVLNTRHAAPVQRLAAALLLAAATLSLGTLWELVEWTSDNLIGTDMSLGYTDTLRDLTADAAGALAGAGASLRLRRATPG